MFTILVEQILQVNASDRLFDLLVTHFNKYDDFRYFFYKNVAKIVKKESLSKTAETSAALFRVLLALEPAQLDPESIVLCCETPLTGTNGDKINHIMVPKSYQRAFSDCWLASLTLPLKFGIYKSILESIHQKVIPNMTNPTSLMDFFVDAYNSGGLISILSLNGLFTLIHEHNLDYPNFYHKLYALFDSNILHVKYRSRFFRLSELFLSSAYIPSYMVASFIKRMCRLALFAPPAAIVFVLPFIFNLLRKHPSCITLIHKVDTESISKGTSY